MKRAITFIMFLVVNSSYGATATGKIVYVGTYGNGDVYVNLDTNIPELGCNSTRFDIPKSRANAKDVLLTAYTAMEQDKFVRVSTKGCYLTSPTLDNSRNSWFLIDK